MECDTEDEDVGLAPGRNFKSGMKKQNNFVISGEYKVGRSNKRVVVVFLAMKKRCALHVVRYPVYSLALH